MNAVTSLTPPPSAYQPSPRFLSMKEVCALTGFSRTHIYRLEAARKFPRRRKIGLAKIGFLEPEIHAWISTRPIPALPSEDDA